MIFFTIEASDAAFAAFRHAAVFFDAFFFSPISFFFFFAADAYRLLMLMLRHAAIFRSLRFLRRRYAAAAMPFDSCHAFDGGLLATPLFCRRFRFVSDAALPGPYAMMPPCSFRHAALPPLRRHVVYHTPVAAVTLLRHEFSLLSICHFSRFAAAV